MAAWGWGAVPGAMWAGGVVALARWPEGTRRAWPRAGWGVERIQAIRPGDTIALGPYQATVAGAATLPGPNYQENAVRIDLRQGGAVVASIAPARRVFTTRPAKVSPAGPASLRA